MTDYTTTCLIDGAPADVFAAVLDTRAWWNSSIAENAVAIGDEFAFDIPGLHRTRIRLVDAVPGRRVAWEVVDNAFGFVVDQTEWVGDRLVFDIEADGSRTRLTFTQQGLVPELECYDVCSKAWTFFVCDSLRSLVETGRGAPESGQADNADVPRDEFFDSTTR